MEKENLESKIEQTAIAQEAVAEVTPAEQSAEVVVEKPETVEETAQNLGLTNISNPDVLVYPATLQEGKNTISGHFIKNETEDGKITGYSLIDNEGKGQKKFNPKQFSEILAGKTKGTKVNFEVPEKDYLEIPTKLETGLHFNDIVPAKDEKEFKEQMESIKSKQVVRLVSPEDQKVVDEFKYEKTASRSINNGEIVADPFIKAASAGRKPSEKALEYEDLSRKAGVSSISWTKLYNRVQAGEIMQFSQPLKEFYKEEDKRIIEGPKPAKVEVPQVQEQKPAEQKVEAQPVEASKWLAVDQMPDVTKGKFVDLRELVRQGNLAEVLKSDATARYFGLSREKLFGISDSEEYKYSEFDKDANELGRYNLSNLEKEYDLAEKVDGQEIFRYRDAGLVPKMPRLSVKPLITAEQAQELTKDSTTISRVLSRLRGNRPMPKLPVTPFEAEKEL